MNNKKLTIYLLTGFLCLFGWPTIAHAQSSTTIRGTGLQPLVEESGTTQTLNIYGPGGVIIAQVATDSPAGGSPTTQTRYLLHDHLGSTRVVLDSNNQVLGSFDYSPFGETTVSNGATGNVADVAYRYTGQEVNGALGTYNYHARHYNAGVGRFLGVDPARQFASSYVYVGNNPINGVDPTGGINIPVDAETFKQLGRAARAIKWAREQAPYAGNNRSDVVATHAESAVRLNILRRVMKQYTTAWTTANEETIGWAAGGAVACAGGCGEFSDLTYAYLTFIEPDVTRPILRAEATDPSHTFTLIGDPDQLPPEQVIVADAWPTRLQATRLSDTRWSAEKIRGSVNPTSKLMERNQSLFSYYQEAIGRDWKAITSFPGGTGYNLADRQDPINASGRRAEGIINFDDQITKVLSDSGLRDVNYSTKLAEPYNYISPDGRVLLGNIFAPD